MLANDQTLWFALRTRARHEKCVRDQLVKNGIEPFLPTYRRWSQWKDRKKQIDFPLFAGYCFAKFLWRERVRVLQIPGVVQIVGTTGNPEPIPIEEIEALRTLQQSAMPYAPYHFLQPGTTVEVIRGPLVGIRGTLLRMGQSSRLVIGVNLLQQGAVVEIDIADVVPLSRVEANEKKTESRF